MRIILVALKIAVLPASHCWPTDKSGMCKFGTRWHSRAAFGRFKGRSPLDVARIWVLLAAVIRMPLGVVCSSASGIVSSHKLMVHPVSTAMIGESRGEGR